MSDSRDRMLQARVRLDLGSTEENDAIREVADTLRDHPGVADFTTFVDAVLERQSVDPPLLGHGIALPHARTHAVTEIVTAFGVSPKDIPFGPDATPVRFVVLIGTPPNRASEYLAWVAALVRRLADADVRDALLDSDDPRRFLETLAG
ncbi:MAG: PTS sugar transporter subunit IIA [Planctomycetes bacterium]|nr:PTS sugar transporter subunit IIA [Planctomycetota bacterium]